MKHYAYREDGTTVKENEVIRDFRGEDWIFLGVTSRSKVYAAKGTRKQEFFPQVFQLYLGVEDSE